MAGGGSVRSTQKTFKPLKVSAADEERLQKQTQAIWEHRKKGEFNEAKAIATRIVSRCRYEYGERRPQILACSSVLTRILFAAGSLQEAERAQLRLLDMQRRVLGPHHVEMLRSAWWLSRIYYALHDPDSAYETWLPYVGDDTVIEQDTIAGGDQSTMTRIENSLVLLYEHEGRKEDLAAFRRHLSNEGALRPPIIDASTQPTSIKKLGLPGIIDGKMYAALADTGSELNVISQRLALEMNLVVWPLFCTFAMGNSRKISSVGCAQFEWMFQNDPFRRKYPVLVHVLPTSVFDLILGDHFLSETKVLTTERHLLEKCSFPSHKTLSLSLLDSPKRRVEGHIQRNWSDKAQRVFAVPDTGAEANFMSEKWALIWGYEIIPSRNYVQFVDGSEEPTLGHVELFWTFSGEIHRHQLLWNAELLGHGPRVGPVLSSMPIKLTFHILKECRADVVLGQDLLHISDLFNRFAEYLVFRFRYGRKPGPEHGKKYEALKPELEDDSKELERQSQWDEDTRPTATADQIQREDERRAAYKQRRKEHLERVT
ncbi:uncharacterized protein PAC_15367 [Phialocephala subalpina]|uniref:Uncharacterized protein n=1 Tax=Phialocephala subalpina TaxID=576137 RepID=A0A1L7XKK1_9HELO|nr:uncharacterized protein PAC_15367 [Phialocephala subalpina]